jgi:tetratricopeptide (TPR) repeat protein
MRRTLTTALLLALLALSGLTHAESAADDPRVVDEHLRVGLVAYWKLDFQGAERHFQAAVDADPDSAAALYYLGYTVYKIAEPKRRDDPGKRRAAAWFARAFAIDPGFTPGWGAAGRP